MRYLWLALFIIRIGSASAADLQLQVSNETVPAGAMANIKITAVTPQPIGSGQIVMDFDPAVFGDIAGVSVFSVNGDAVGVATAKGQHLEVTFVSPLSGIGRSPGFPILQVTIPVLATAALGAAAAITFDPKNVVATDSYGPGNAKPYTISVVPAV